METLLSRGFGSRRDSTTRLQGRKQSQGFRSANNNKIAARCSRQEWKKFSYSNFSCPDPSHLQCKQEFYQCLVSSSVHSSRDPGNPWGAAAAAAGQGSHCWGSKAALCPWSHSQASRRGLAHGSEQDWHRQRSVGAFLFIPCTQPAASSGTCPGLGLGAFGTSLVSLPFLSSWGLSLPWNERLLRWVLYLLWEPPLVEAQSPPRVSGASGVTQLYKIQRSLCMRREGLKPQVYQ